MKAMVYVREEHVITYEVDVPKEIRSWSELDEYLRAWKRDDLPDQLPLDLQVTERVIEDYDVDDLSQLEGQEDV